MTSFAVGEPVSMPKPSMRRQTTPNNSNTSFSLSTSDSILNGSFEKEALGNSMTETEGILKSYDPSFDGQNDVSNFVNSIFNDDKAQANLPHGRSFTSFGSSMELKEPFLTYRCSRITFDKNKIDPWPVFENTITEKQYQDLTKKTWESILQNR